MGARSAVFYLELTTRSAKIVRGEVVYRRGEGGNRSVDGAVGAGVVAFGRGHFVSAVRFRAGAIIVRRWKKASRSWPARDWLSRASAVFCDA